jgi:hypothetical protein
MFNNANLKAFNTDYSLKRTLINSLCLTLVINSKNLTSSPAYGCTFFCNCPCIDKKLTKLTEFFC